jgi:hypothetical protein
VESICNKGKGVGVEADSDLGEEEGERDAYGDDQALLLRQVEHHGGSGQIKSKKQKESPSEGRCHAREVQLLC